MINSKRYYYLLLLSSLLLFIGAILLTIYTNSWLTKKSETLVTLKLETAALEEEQKVSQKAANYLEENESMRLLLEKIVPKNKDQANAIGELLKISDEIGVTINTFSFPASELGNNTKNVAVAGTAPASTTSGADIVTQAKPVINIPGILGIEVSLSQIDRRGGDSGSGITYDQLLRFLEAIEKNRRTMQIKTMQVSPLKSSNGKINGYSLVLTINIFVKS